MTYDTLAQSKFLNNVVELVSFRTGPNSYIHCSTHTEEITINGTIYKPTPFNRDAKRLSTAFEDDNLKIVVHPDHPICDHYRNMMTDYDVSVLVRQGYLTDDGEPFAGAINTYYPILAIGWVGSVETDTNSGDVTLSIVSIGDTLSAPTLNRNFQQSCPLRLYGPKCKATKSPIAISVFTIHRSYIEVPMDWFGTTQLKHWIGGLVTFTIPDLSPQYRMITRVENNRIHYTGSDYSLADAVSISVLQGCAHTIEACRDQHDNSRRYGGFPWQPLENPVNKSIR